MKYYRDIELLKRFGKNLTILRETVDLSSAQMQHATGISSSNIDSIEVGKLNTSLSQAARLSDFFGLEIGNVTAKNFHAPSSEEIQKNVDKFLKEKGIDPKVFIKKGLAYLLKRKVITSQYFNTPKYSVELANYLREKFGVQFTTTAISQALENLRKEGLIEKIQTDKKSKFQYKKK